jgi:hypothetical protein
MKVVQKTSRLLKLKQTNWMPWYGHFLLWPTVGLFLLMSLAGQSSTLTCSRVSGQCQLNNELISDTSKKTIPIDAVTKVDVVATDNTSEEPSAQMVLITKDGELNLGLQGEFEARDEAAGKLAWFFEDPNSKFIELTESDKSWMTGFGLTGLVAILGAFLLRKTSVVSFDRDTERCTVQLSRFFGLVKGRQEVCELANIQNIDLSGSLKVADDRILVHRSGSPSFFLTDYATRDPRNELTAVNNIKEFLGMSLKQSNSQPQNSFGAENGWTEEESAYYGSSSEEYTTTESYSSSDSSSDSSPSSSSYSSDSSSDNSSSSSSDSGSSSSD